jgi:hypothetical protein
MALTNPAAFEKKQVYTFCITTAVRKERQQTTAYEPRLLYRLIAVQKGAGSSLTKLAEPY